MKKAFYLSTCDTCKRILGKLNLPEDIILQDIKKEHISEKDLEYLYNNTRSYEILLNKRAQKYKQEGLKDENLSEEEIKTYILSHYTFLKNSKTSRKQLTKSFIDLLVINTIIPIKFSYAKSQGKSIDEEIFKLIQELKIENNTIVSKFLDYKPFKKNALTSQALLQMKNAYCDKNKCLNCAIGNSLIIKN